MNEMKWYDNVPYWKKEIKKGKQGYRNVGFCEVGVFLTKKNGIIKKVEVIRVLEKEKK